MTRTINDYKRLILEAGVTRENGPSGRHYKIMQNPWELATFLSTLEDQGFTGPFLEVGTGYGGLARLLRDLGRQVVTLDINRPVVDLDGITFIQADSTRDQTVDLVHAALEALETALFDVVLIDGNGYQVEQNYGLYAPLGRVVALHDIAGDTPQGDFWRSLQPGLRRRRKPADTAIATENAIGLGWHLTGK